MNDTSTEVARFVRERYAGMSGATRVMMGADMFEMARAMALASFPPGLTERETRRRLCERFYGTLAERVFGAAHAQP
jgi:hypothetical protein